METEPQFKLEELTMIGDLWIVEYVVICILVVIFGSLIGSFLNVLIYRIPKKLNFAKGRSFCPNCSHSLASLDLVPVFSYLFLRCKCRYCGEKISFRYAFVEILTALLFLYIFMELGLTGYSVTYMLITSVLITISFIDIDCRIIPDSANLVIFIIAVVSVILNPDVSALDAIIGFFVISAPMLLLAVLANGFGGGDIKLMAAAGVLLGWQSTIVAFLIGSFLASLYAFKLMADRKAGKKTAIFFGPFLSVGIFLSGFYGSNIIEWYMSLYQI